MAVIIIIVLIPLTLIVSWQLGDRRYYICSVLIIVYAVAAFIVGFERCRPGAREIVVIAVMCAIAVAARSAFIMLPQFKPMVGIIIICGMSFGPGAGFVTGAVSAFVSNFIFGQGPWTPWQMFAFGIAGLLAGLLAEKNIIDGGKRVVTAVVGGLTVLLIVGPLLDTCTLFTISSEISKSSVGAVYLAGLPFNAVHAAATVITLLVLAKPMTEKLERIKIKYGIMETKERKLRKETGEGNMR